MQYSGQEMGKKAKTVKMEGQAKEERKKKAKALKNKPSTFSGEATGSVVPLNEAAKVRPCLLLMANLVQAH